jgi:hypothetical protein
MVGVPRLRTDLRGVSSPRPCQAGQLGAADPGRNQADSPGRSSPSPQRVDTGQLPPAIPTSEGGCGAAGTASTLTVADPRCRCGCLAGPVSVSPLPPVSVVNEPPSRWDGSGLRYTPRRPAKIMVRFSANSGRFFAENPVMTLGPYGVRTSTITHAPTAPGPACLPSRTRVLAKPNPTPPCAASRSPHPTKG